MASNKSDLPAGAGLYQEVLAWEEVNSELFNSTDLMTKNRILNPIRVREPFPDMDGEARGYHGRNIGEGSFGWLGIDGRGKRGDSWRFHFASQSPAPTLSDFRAGHWIEAVMPTRWDGEVAYVLAKEWAVGPLLTVGKIWGEEGMVTWVVPGAPIESPRWPKLGPGLDAERSFTEMKLQGVLWRIRNAAAGHRDRVVSNVSELYGAWSSLSGEFLGWEKIASLENLRGNQVERTRRLEKLPGWEKMEGGIREQSMGREV